VDITLAPAATALDARDVWCDIVIPMGGSVYTAVTRGNKYWPPPADCSDPSDVPAARSPDH
jgi:hypothetical protein